MGLGDNWGEKTSRNQEANIATYEIRTQSWILDRQLKCIQEKSWWQQYMYLGQFWILLCRQFQCYSKGRVRGPWWVLVGNMTCAPSIVPHQSASFWSMILCRLPSAGSLNSPFPTMRPLSNSQGQPSHWDKYYLPKVIVLFLPPI